MTQKIIDQSMADADFIRQVTGRDLGQVADLKVALCGIEQAFSGGGSTERSSAYVIDHTRMIAC